MADIDKVIRGLELCEIGSGDRCYETECPYYGQGCTESLKNDILDLLKEQEAVKIEVKKINDSGRCGRCPNCLMELNEMDYPNYCGNCGQKVKWNDSDNDNE